mmetsp:Transcript_51645/g.96741  ORF Transcript_51645/g.96741 Transcript_51645/m.96741 type:complete len:462 (-) Transcript_51645:147-1532(-)
MAMQKPNYGAHPLHFAVWRGNAETVRILLHKGHDPNVVDADGQTPWAWAEAKGNEPMMNILSEYGGGPLPVWSLKVESHHGELLLSCTNFAGAIVYHAGFPEDVLVSDVLAAIAGDTGKAATLVLPSNYVIGMSDYHLSLRLLLDSPPATEKRKDPIDGQSYTKREFYKYYGSQEGQQRWSMAEIDEDNQKKPGTPSFLCGCCTPQQEEYETNFQADSQLHAETQPELELDALERVLLEDSNSSCLQQQADVQEAILRSNLSEPMSSLQKQCHGGSQHGASQTSSSGCCEDVGQSVISSAGSEPKCYICGTRFRSSDGMLKAVEDIGINELLLGVDGSCVKVVSIKRHTSMDQVMVLLCTSSSQIVLTHNHRVLTLRGASQRQTIPAGHLREGDAILSTRGQEHLIEVTPFLGEDDDVYEIVLEPDAEIEAFYINSENTAILTKGKRTKATHRGNMRRRSS